MKGRKMWGRKMKTGNWWKATPDASQVTLGALISATRSLQANSARFFPQLNSSFSALHFSAFPGATHF